MLGELVGRQVLSSEEKFTSRLWILFRYYQEDSVSKGSIGREVWKLVALSENGIAWEAVFNLVWILNGCAQVMSLASSLL